MTPVKAIGHLGIDYFIAPGNFVTEWQRNTLIVLLVLTLLKYHIYLMQQCCCRSKEVGVLKENLEEVTSELEELQRTHARLVAAVQRTPWALIESVSPLPHSILILSYENGSTLEYEKLRRRALSNTKELWYFLSDRLRTAVGETFEGQQRIMAATLEQVAERKRWLLYLLEQLPLADGREQWRRQEAARVGELVQRRLRYLQHPEHCSRARKLLCPYEWHCGFTCSLHYIASCLVHAYATKRVLILRHEEWRYSGEERRRWEHVFQPLSYTCTDYNETFTVMGTGGAMEDDAAVLYVPTALYKKSVKSRIPLHYIPEDLSPSIVRFSSDPASWWTGQLLVYILRPQQRVLAAMNTALAHMDFRLQMVGVHVRHNEKSFKKADLFPLEEYMSRVEEYYRQLELTSAAERRVYLATDDANVIKEASLKYPQYKFYSNMSRAVQAAPRTRYSIPALTDLLVDIRMLTVCDYVVCTLSSNIGRTVLELLHTIHAHASSRLASLDVATHYHRAEPTRRLAVMRNTDIGLNVTPDIGGIIEAVNWNFNSYGTLLKTNLSGRIPWYKTEEILVLYPFPEYESATREDDYKDYSEAYDQ